MSMRNALDGVWKDGLQIIAQGGKEVVQHQDILEELLWAKLAKSLANYVVVMCIKLDKVEKNNKKTVNKSREIRY